MQGKEVSIRKRAQISAANRAVFVWVAGTSIIVGAALVVVVFLVQMLWHNEKVLSAKQNTISTLEKNIKLAPELKKKITALDANQNLLDSRIKSNLLSISATQVVLDALPATANSLAFGASLQNVLLANVPITSISVTPVSGLESISDASSMIDPGADQNVSANQIAFSFVVTGDEASLRTTLENLQASIRTIDIYYLKIDSQDNSLTLTVRGRAFYEPAKKVELKDMTVR